MDSFNHYLPWTLKRVKQIAPEVWERLLLPSQNVEQDQKIPVTNLMVLLYEKLHGHADLKTFNKRAELISWFNQYGRSIFNIDDLENVLSGSVNECLTLKTGGVNLIGYNRGRLGLGEDIRGYAALLDKMNVEYSILHIGHPTDDPLNYTHPKEGLPTFDRSVFFLNAIELEKLVNLYNSFDSTFGRAVAVPPWELEKTPHEWTATLAYFEQVWGISGFVTKALENVHHNTLYSAPVVLPPKINNRTKETQNQPFRFLFIFDAGSFIERKNPLAVVNAFQSAFSRYENVELVIKVSNSSESAHWQNVEQKAASDRRIKLIRGLITEAELCQLWDTANCYVSLHRSEGFGRTMADAVLRKLPVIATNYSGSTDLFPKDYDLLVDYTLVAIETGEYPFAQDAKWASASIEDAAKKMQLVYENRRSLALSETVESAYQHVQQRFGLDNQIRPLKKWLL
ncbi:glycosyltransferase [Alteromonas sp. 345S023]|uniref:Glycosyltransferase n=1 Tax=Alteromonas profundi TaxID=2696062 RepID=A0A7X5LMK7_9ALTE|nr:glycosyltransferase [Alteromonas profundi]NDV91684.1 glycosyltransferase [Alteromonas profundi]